MNIQDLKTQIIKANNAYRNGNAIISDEEYDVLLETAESEMGFIEYADFLETLTESKGTVANKYVLGSLSKFKFEETDKFYDWIIKQRIKVLFASDKIDDCSFYAEYRQGKLTLLTSRGDGDEGTDWTAKAPYIKIPQTVPVMTDLDIRGEVTLINEDHEILGYKNKRNGTAGIMNKDEVQPEKLKYVHAFAYEVLSGKLNIKEQFDFLNKAGFNTSRYKYFDVSKTVHEEIKAYYNDRRAKAVYAMDGMVLSHPSYTPEDVFLPKGKVAFKINSTGVKTTVNGIEWNISKGGLLKPVVLLEAVEIDGTTVQRATGNNFNYLMENGIGIGAEVLIIKSGEIIPKIIKVEKKAGVDIPMSCPSCGNALSMKGVDLCCNNTNCGATKVKSLASFLIKAGVEGFTENSLESFGISDFNQLVNFHGDKSKNQTKFLMELQKNIFNKTQEELFGCMTFDGAGRKSIAKIIKHYGGTLEDATRALYIRTMQDVADQIIDPDELEYPEGIGEKIIAKIKADWIANIKNLQLIMVDKRYNPVVKAAPVVKDSGITGKSFCVTGKLSKGRKEIEAMIVENGGVLKSVSKKLDYLVAGDDAGSKLEKAQNLNIPVLTEDELLGMI